MRFVGVLDMVSVGVECKLCKRDLWIVDGDGEGEFWLLCVGNHSAIVTMNIPSDMRVEDESQGA